MTLRAVREVREVTPVSVCNCLREVNAGGARAVREVTLQVVDFVAGGNRQSAAARALYTTYIPGRLLQVARPGLGEEAENEAFVSDMRVLVGLSFSDWREVEGWVLSQVCAATDFSGPRAVCGLAANRFAALVRGMGVARSKLIFAGREVLA